MCNTFTCIDGKIPTLCYSAQTRCIAVCIMFSQFCKNQTVRTYTYGFFSVYAGKKTKAKLLKVFLLSALFGSYLIWSCLSTWNFILEALNFYGKSSLWGNVRKWLTYSSFFSFVFLLAEKKGKIRWK